MTLRMRARGRSKAAGSAGFASLTVLVALSLSTSGQPGYADPPSARSTVSAAQPRLTGKVQFNKVSGPESGVELLEKIFSKVMNLPQLAMANQSPMQQSLAPAPEPQRDALMIRPKEKANKQLYTPQSPSLRMLPQAKTELPHAKPQSEPTDSLGDYEEGQSQLPSQGSASGFGLPPTNMGKYVHQAGDRIQQSQSRHLENGLPDGNDNWSGNSLARGVSRDRADLGVRSWEPGGGGGGGFGNNGVVSYSPPSATAAAPESDALDKDSGVGKKSTRRSVPDLGTAVGRLSGVLKTVDEAQKMAEAAEQGNLPSSNYPTNASAPAVIPIANQGEYKQSNLKGQNFYKAPKQVQILDDRPVVRDFRSAPSAPQTIQLPSPPSAKNKLPSGAVPAQIVDMAPLRQKIASNQAASGYRANYGSGMNTTLQAGVSGRLAQRKEDAAAGASMYDQKARQAVDALRKLDASGKREMIALLPPNVATGIPLVSLGTSDVQVATALKGIGELKEQKVGQWTVQSWRKGGKTSLQLFFRHGLLDAIRIYDPALIAPDFGVAPGASLERMKQKFGEPAWMIEEPKVNESQNYIYPISQVGFQLARRDPDADPEVVSVLIFSVK